jgi:ketosteroid isomerase-like protein
MGVMTDASAVAATYFDAWKARDFARLRSVLADDVDFAGPLARVRGGDECLRGLQGMAQIMTGLEVRKVFHDEPEVLTWFDLATSVADTVPVRTGCTSRTARSLASGWSSTPAASPAGPDRGSRRGPMPNGPALSPPAPG